MGDGKTIIIADMLKSIERLVIYYFLYIPMSI